MYIIKLYVWANLSRKGSSDIFHNFFKIYVLYYVLSFIATFFIVIVDKIVIYVLNYESVINSHYSTDLFIKRVGLAEAIVLITISGPIFEELAFRLILIPSRFKISLSTSSLLFLLICLLWTVNNFETYIICFFICLVFFTIIYCFLNQIFINKLIKNRFTLFIVSSVLFGMIHLFNYSDFKYELIIIYPIYVLPQIIMGFLLGAIRIKHGFVWTVLLHILINGTLIWYKLF
ncbi:CPBP family glutamic-type intramembrane protease [Fibrella aquatica]|uniref:CPBP family glutamic-type intramembrane protease n=1 Tax=Fibrella aquatica TaxID=3242487 RepID=UPI003521A65B